ncbi:BAR-domain-containing protein [Microstroma glucosiphilum]|uniref:BAR-domain-containing protein n=1 Tax=Pseudomicrostroma glucosiphilum TaxID=1684307 RepID=A0A316UBG6_9BASI|nr:BAR-domain-containing protein [Pseudomicrostroma glucosiphilum]PWN20365.1 BAR-domain-containing protein [Pseudomicrostroma glucosiphilum]
MKGITKFAKRTPHLLTTRVGMASKSHDAAFDDLNRRFTAIEKYTEKLVKDSTSFRDAVKSMLLSGAAFGTSFSDLFHPIGSEYDLEGKHPESVNTIAELQNYQLMMEELRETLTPEIELIDSRVVAPSKEFEGVLKAIRKNITKRDHKLVDYDRINNSFTKLKEKKEKTLKDEQSLFKLEQEYEAATADYEYYNNAMKEELPIFFDKVKALMAPLFHSFYYMQLNVFYLTLDKIQTFADGKYDLSNATPESVEQRYADMLTDAAERLEALTIRKPAAPSARVLTTAGRTPGLNSSASSSKATGLAAGAPSRTGTLGSLGRTPSSSAAPPSYSGSPSSAAKKAPPPPPPTKPKPGALAPRDYVIALYDYTAQADGDLSFTAGERIEVTERTASTDDWWTGVGSNGQKGIFPGNYVRDE